MTDPLTLRLLATRFKDPKSPFKILIVRDMWLTGFDAPCLHTMYADKPMQGHGLMQAIARVNRVFRDKPGGLVVDYLGLADQLKKALITYTESGGQGNPTFDTAQAIAVMLEKHGIACDLMHGFNWDKWTTGKPTERLALIPVGQEHGEERMKDECRRMNLRPRVSSFIIHTSAFKSRRHPPAREQGHHHRRPGDRRFHRRRVAQAGHLTPSPPAQSGCAQRCALSVSVAPLAPSAAS